MTTLCLCFKKIVVCSLENASEGKSMSVEKLLGRQLVQAANGGG